MRPNPPPGASTEGTATSRGLGARALQEARTRGPLAGSPGFRRLQGAGLRISQGVLLALVLVFLSACTPQNRAPNPQGGIVSLTPSLTETLFELGLGSRITGVTDSDAYPEEVLALPRVCHIMVPDYERLVAMQPERVVADSVIVSQEVLDRLRSLGLAVLAVQTRSLEDLATNLGVLGEGLGAPEAAARARERLAAELRDLEGLAASLPRRPKVFVEVWNEPLMTTGRGGLAHDLVQRAGGDNVYGDLGDDSPTVSLEDLLRRDPDVILLTTSRPKDLVHRPGWERLKAVREGHVHAVDADTVARPTLRAVRGLRHLHDLFRQAVSPGRRGSPATNAVPGPAAQAAPPGTP